MVGSAHFSGHESWRSPTTPDNIVGVILSKNPAAGAGAWCRRLALPLSMAMLLPARASAAPNPVVATGTRGQQTLSVGISDGQLHLRLCASAACDPAQGQVHSLPSEVTPLLERATLSVVPLGEGRQVVHVVAPDPAKGRAYELLVTAPLAGTSPNIVFEGFTGLTSGQPGERQGPMVFVSEEASAGARRVVVGKQYEAISLCGRPTVLVPQLLYPADLKLHPAKMQRLSPAERDRAPRLKAERLPEGTVLGASVLTAVGASSAVGAPQNLTDGDLKTSWAENRGAEGRGEFVKLNVPPQLPIAGFDFVVRPTRDDVASEATSASEFWLATRDRVFRVTVPDDAWQYPGAVYRVMLEAPLQTDCVALVVEAARSKNKDAQVTFAEVTAVSEFNSSDLSELVGALAGGGERAEAAKTVLMSGGPEAYDAVAKAYSKLDEGGRRVALDVMDQAGCELATPTYVKALLGRYEAHSIHARDRIRRCGRKSADYLAKTLRIARPRARPILANELGLVAPDRAIVEIAPLLEDEQKGRRSAMRIALARAAADPTANDAVKQVLRDDSLSDRVRLDVLRALGARLPDYGTASQNLFARLAQHQDFRTQYLLLNPASALAEKDERARQFLGQAITSHPNQYIRYGATLAAQDTGQFNGELLAAVSDKAVRVRKAAVEALGKKREVRAQAALLDRLAHDHWPMVRGAAADALGGLGASPTIDQALTDALTDESPTVRAPVALALGQRGVSASAGALRHRLSDKKEHGAVRRAAAQALGRLCDHDALDLLTELAQKRADPLLDQDQKALAVVALQALAAVGPRDLRERVAPLMQKGAAPGARDAAERALAQPAACARR